jgi:hypothetical protein
MVFMFKMWQWYVNWRYLTADDYFSQVKNDNISVWEDESVSFEVLSNDYIAAGQPEGVNLSSVSLLSNVFATELFNTSF